MCSSFSYMQSTRHGSKRIKEKEITDTDILTYWVMIIATHFLELCLKGVSLLSMSISLTSPGIPTAVQNIDSINKLVYSSFPCHVSRKTIQLFHYVIIIHRIQYNTLYNVHVHEAERYRFYKPFNNPCPWPVKSYFVYTFSLSQR